MKSYLRYEPRKAFGVIASPSCNVAFDFSGNLAITAGIQDLNVWNLRQGTQIANLDSNVDSGYPYSAQGEVTVMCRSPDKQTVAIGYSTGEIKIFNYITNALVTTLRGHRSAVTSLAYDELNSDRGLFLASGGADTDIFVWDLVANLGLARLRGHKGAVTGVGFVTGAQNQRLLISVSKDTQLKVWDLDTVHCVQTILGHRTEIWCLAVLKPHEGSGCRVITGCGDDQIRGYRVRTGKRINDNANIDKDTEGADKDKTETMAVVASSAAEPSLLLDDDENVLEYYGSISRKPSGSGSSDRCMALSINAKGTMVAAQSSGKVVEFFQMRDRTQTKKKMQRRLKRQREKESKALVAASNGEEETGVSDAVGWDAYKEDSKKNKKRKGNNKKEKDTDEGDNRDDADSDSGSEEEDDEDDDEEVVNNQEAVLTDEMEYLSTLRCGAKLKGCAFHPLPGKGNTSSPGQLVPEKVLLSLVNNSLEMYHVPPQSQDNTRTAIELQPQKAMLLDLQGHRSDVRGVAISPDGFSIATCSTEGVKLWSSKTFQCIRSCGDTSTSSKADLNGVCVQFAPGGRYLVVGTKDGTCQVLDTASGECVSSQERAHSEVKKGKSSKLSSQKNKQNQDDDDDAGYGSDENEGEAGNKTIGVPIWAVAVRPDGNGFCTGGADSMVKFWDFHSESETGQTGLTATIERQLQLESEALCLCYNNAKDDKLLVAIGLMDSTIKVFFEDSMKFFLSLYGHKLPVLSVSVSSDSKILVSGSADKTVKIWGLDFGDCHRSLVGHTDSVTAIMFQFDTHYFFSGSKDGVVKYWDADRFEQVLHLPGHKGPVWALDVSHDGSFACTGGQDRTVRVWERGEDLVFVEEERERRLEALADQAAGKADADEVKAGEGVGGEAGDSGAIVSYTEAASAVKTLESVRSGENLMTALDLAEDEMQDIGAHEERQRKLRKLSSSPAGTIAKRAPNLLLLGLSPEAYLIRALKMITQPDLEPALLQLPFHYVTRCISALIRLCKHSPADIELCCRCAVFLLRCHFTQIVAARVLIDEVALLKDVVRSNIRDYRDIIGVNMAGLRHMKRGADEAAQSFMGIPDLPNDMADSQKSKKRKKGGKKAIERTI